MSTQFQLNYNALTGRIPTQLGGLVMLTELYVHDNFLSGTIPPQVGAQSQLAGLLIRVPCDAAGARTDGRFVEEAAREVLTGVIHHPHQEDDCLRGCSRVCV